MKAHITKLQYHTLYIRNKSDISQLHIQQNIQIPKHPTTTKYPCSNQSTVSSLYHFIHQQSNSTISDSRLNTKTPTSTHKNQLSYSLAKQGLYKDYERHHFNRTSRHGHLKISTANQRIHTVPNQPDCNRQARRRGDLRQQPLQL